MNTLQDCRRKPRVLAAILGIAFGTALVPVAASAADWCPRFVSRSQGLPVAGEWRTHPVLADVNRDGRLDLGATVRKGVKPTVWLGQADGSWLESSRGIAVPGRPCGVGVTFADINGDGNLDFGVADHCSGPWLFIGNGKGEWKAGPRPIQRNVSPLDDMQFGDLDNDGDLDMVGLAGMSGGFRVSLGDGKGRWTPHESGLPTDGFGNDVKLADLNKDGLLDVLAAFKTEGGRKLQVVHLGVGGAKFERLKLPLLESDEIQGVDTGDVNMDGHLDIAFTSHTRTDLAELKVLLGDGKGGFTPSNEGLPQPGEPLIGLYGVELADLDGDRRDDLVVSTHRSAGLRVWMRSADGTWNDCPDVGVPLDRDELRGWGIDVADINGDGRPDVALGFGRNGQGGVEAWILDGAGGPALPGKIQSPSK